MEWQMLKDLKDQKGHDQAKGLTLRGFIHDVMLLVLMFGSLSMLTRAYLDLAWARMRNGDEHPITLVEALVLLVLYGIGGMCLTFKLLYWIYSFALWLENAEVHLLVTKID